MIDTSSRVFVCEHHKSPTAHDALLKFLLKPRFVVLVDACTYGARPGYATALTCFKTAQGHEVLHHTAYFFTSRGGRVLLQVTCQPISTQPLICMNLVRTRPPADGRCYMLIWLQGFPVAARASPCWSIRLHMDSPTRSRRKTTPQQLLHAENCAMPHPR